MGDRVIQHFLDFIDIGQVFFIKDLVVFQLAFARFGVFRLHFQNCFIIADNFGNHHDLDQVLGGVAGFVGLGGRIVLVFIDHEVVLAFMGEGNVLEGDLAAFIFHLHQPGPEFLGIVVIFLLQQHGAQLFQVKLELLLVGGGFVVNQLLHFQVAVEAQQVAAVVGVQMAFTHGPHLVAHHAAAVVAALNIHKSGGRHHVAEFGGDVGGHVDPLREGEIVHHRHAGAVFGRIKACAVQRQLGAGISAAAQVADHCAGDFVGVGDGVAARVLSNNVDGDNRVFGVVQNDVGTRGHVNRGVGVADDVALIRRAAGQLLAGVDNHRLQPVPIHKVVPGDGVAAVGARVAAQLAAHVFRRLHAVDVEIAGHGVHGAHIAVPAVVVVVAVVEEGAAGFRHIPADHGGLRDQFGVAHAGAALVDHVAADQHAAHAVVFHQEVAVIGIAGGKVFRGGRIAVAGRGGGVGAQGHDVVVVQDIFQGIAVKFAVVRCQPDDIGVLDVPSVFRVVNRFFGTVGVIGFISVDVGIADHLVILHKGSQRNGVVQLVGAGDRGALGSSVQLHLHVLFVAADAEGLAGRKAAVPLQVPLVFTEVQQVVAFLILLAVVQLDIAVAFGAAGEGYGHFGVHIRVCGNFQRFIAHVHLHLVLGGVRLTDHDDPRFVIGRQIFHEGISIKVAFCDFSLAERVVIVVQAVVVARILIVIRCVEKTDAAHTVSAAHRLGVGHIAALGFEAVQNHRVGRAAGADRHNGIAHHGGASIRTVAEQLRLDVGLVRNRRCAVAAGRHGIPLRGVHEIDGHIITAFFGEFNMIVSVSVFSAGERQGIRTDGRAAVFIFRADMSIRIIVPSASDIVQIQI